MRRIVLPALGVLTALIVLLVIGPMIIDWNAYRGRIEQTLSQVAGRPVAIKGDIRLSSLPIPSLDLKNIVIPDASPGISVQAERLIVQFKLFSLLQGQYDIDSAVLQRAVIGIIEEGPAAGTALAASVIQPPSGRDPGSAGNLASAKLTIVDAELRNMLTSTSLARLNADLAYSRDKGVLSGNGAVGLGARQLKLRFALDKITAGTPHVNLLVEDEVASASAVLDGDIRPINDTLDFNGTADAIGALALWTSDTPRSLAWHAKSRARLSGNEMKFDGIEVRLGSAPKESIFTGEGGAVLGSELTFNARLHAGTLDLDTLIGIGNPSIVLPFNAFNEIRQFFDHKSDEKSATGFTVDISADKVMTGGDQMDAFKFVATGRADAWAIETAALTMPGGARLAIKGTPLSTLSVANILSGRFLLEIADQRRFFAWIDGQPPAVAKADDAPPQPIKIEADAVFEPKGLWLPKLNLDFGGTSFSGDARYQFSKSEQVAKSEQGGLKRAGLGLISARLQSPAIDLKVLPLGNLKQTPGVTPDLDLDLKVGSVVYGEANLKGLSLSFHREKDRRSVEKLIIEDVAGARIEGGGSLTATEQSAGVKLKAAQLAPFAEMIRQAFPGPFSDVFSLRAQSLSPADIDTTLVMADEDGEPVVKFKTTGKVDSTSLNASGTWQIGPVARRNRVQLAFDADDQVKLLRQLGFNGRLGTAVEPGKLTISANGNIAKGYELGLMAQAADSKLDIAGQVVFTSPAPFDGKVTLDVRDLYRLGQIIGANPALLPRGASARVEGHLLASLDRISLRDFKASVVREDRPVATLTGDTAVHLDDGPRVAGRIKADYIDGRWLATVPLGVEVKGDVADIGNTAGKADGKSGAASSWTDTPYLAPEPPSLAGDAWVEVDKLALTSDLALDDAQFVIRFKPDLMSFERADVRFGGGRVRGDFSLSRDGSDAVLTAKLEAQDVETQRLAALPFVTRMTGGLDLDGRGASPLQLLKSLQGSGVMALRELRMDTIDPKAALQSAQKPQLDTPAPTQAAKLDDTMKAGAVTAQAGQMKIKIADGLIDFGPLNVKTETGLVQATAQFNLLTLMLNATARINLPQNDGQGGAGEAAVHWSGPPGALVRRLDPPPAPEVKAVPGGPPASTGTIISDTPN